jgi:predicted DNA-binding protein
MAESIYSKYFGVAAQIRVVYNYDVYSINPGGTVMKRTQIYLQESQRKELDKLAAKTGKGLAELIREAVDRYIVENKLADTDYITETSGLWKNRSDIDSDYINRLRNEMNSRLDEYLK